MNFYSIQLIRCAHSMTSMGELRMVTFASRRACCLLEKVPCDPRTIAPAWPHALAFGRKFSGNVGGHRLMHAVCNEFCGLFLLDPTDLAPR